MQDTSENLKSTSQTNLMAKNSNSSAPPPAMIFQGYDSVNGYGLSTAVEGTTTKSGGYTSVDYQIALDIESMYQALDISQSASVGFGPFGSVSEKSEFVKKLNLTTYSLNIIVHSRHIQEVETSTNFKLKSDIQSPLNDSALCEFFQSYGDSFLSSVTHGSEYYAVYTFYAQSKEEQTSVKSELKANGIFEFGTVQADLQVKLDNVSKSTKVTIAFNQNVSGIANPKLPTPDKLVQYAIDFPSIPVDAPAILSFNSTGYQHVPQIINFTPISNNVAYFLGSYSNLGLVNSLIQLIEVKNQISSIKSIYAFYQNYKDANLDNAQTLVNQNIQAIDEQMSIYVNKPTTKFTEPSLPALDLGYPVLNYEIAVTQGYGGDGGSPFDDVNINTFLQTKTYLSSIQLRSGSYVDALITNYTNSNGEKMSQQHGGNGGSLSAVLTLQAGQFISSISGKSGKYVDRLAVTISDGRSVQGGGNGGGDFAFNVPTGSIALGFSGRSGSYLDKVSVTYATFKPAKWVYNS